MARLDCSEAKPLLSAYVDNELELLSSLTLEQHLQTCADCRHHLRALQEIRSSTRRSASYFTAPESLHARIGAAHAEPVRWSMETPWLGALSAFAVLALAVWLVFSVLPGNQSGAQITDQIVSAHVRSSITNHLTDIASSNHHTVKPWFNGRIDFSPPVADFAAQGFPLAGGRVDYVHDRTAAVLVYRRNEHVINVFIWPVREKNAPVTLSEDRGYNVAHWIDAGMEYWAVSDVNAADLKKLAVLFTTVGENTAPIAEPPAAPAA